MAGSPLSGSYADLFPHVRELAELGLEVHPLIAGPPNLAGQAALMRNPKAYIDAAVAESVRNNYAGFNFDNELRGKFTEASWSFLKGYGPPWVAFLDQFAEALHAVNKTLSVDIEGCCGWVDVTHPLGPVGRCGGRSSVPWVGVFGAHEFLDTTCPEYYTSKVDWVYAMGSYGTTINGPAEQPRGKYNYSFGVDTFKNMTTAASRGLGYSRLRNYFGPFCTHFSVRCRPTCPHAVRCALLGAYACAYRILIGALQSDVSYPAHLHVLRPVYATGISGMWVWCRNSSLPATCVFDDTARSTIDWMLDELGANHVAHWVDEGTSQATWDAWGYFLHRR